MRATPIDVGIVPHTHWDREWYAPFQTYRAQLVHWYGAETRWADRPFWRRRLAAQ